MTLEQAIKHSFFDELRDQPNDHPKSNSGSKQLRQLDFDCKEVELTMDDLKKMFVTELKLQVQVSN